MTDDAQPGVRERILRATLRLIGERGVGAVSNREIGLAAGVSLGSITYHFGSQAELLREALLLYVREQTVIREQIAQRLRSEPLDAVGIAAEIERVVAESTDILEQVAELELHLHAARDPAIREASARCFAANDAIATAALHALGVPAPERHAPTVVALMTGLALRRLAAGGQDATGTAEALLLLLGPVAPPGARPVSPASSASAGG
jgi:AcrR family transcriptional regulator